MIAVIGNACMGISALALFWATLRLGRREASGAAAARDGTTPRK
jgi:hypothetical protein